MISRSEHQVLNDILHRAEKYHPAAAKKFHQTTNKKEAARILLSTMISMYPNILIELPESILVKIGAQVDRNFNQKEISLAYSIRGCLVRRILYTPKKKIMEEIDA